MAFGLGARDLFLFVSVWMKFFSDKRLDLDFGFLG
jgi:hypothetical protein